MPGGELGERAGTSPPSLQDQADALHQLGVWVSNLLLPRLRQSPSGHAASLQLSPSDIHHPLSLPRERWPPGSRQRQGMAPGRAARGPLPARKQESQRSSRKRLSTGGSRTGHPTAPCLCAAERGNRGAAAPPALTLQTLGRTGTWRAQPLPELPPEHAGSPQDCALSRTWLPQLLLLPPRQACSSQACQEPREPPPHRRQPTAVKHWPQASSSTAPAVPHSPALLGPHTFSKSRNSRMGNQFVPLTWDKILQERHGDSSRQGRVSHCPSKCPPAPPSTAPAHTLAARLLGRPPGGVSRPSDACSLLPSIFCTQMGSGAGHSKS